MAETQTQTQAERYPHLLNDGKGHVVPWVTRWSGEIAEAPLQVSVDRSGVTVHYADGLEDREPSGILWMREGITRRGRPLWAQVNVYRQRAAMRKRLCQVCGGKVPAGPINWLFAPDDQVIDRKDGSTTTVNPPTCDACLPIALELCPHLAQVGYSIARVSSYRLWGVYGGAVEQRDGALVRVPGASFSYEGDYRPAVYKTAIVAKDQVVALLDFTMEHYPGSANG